MKNYRTPFLIVLIANLVLIAAIAGFWWRSHRSRRHKNAPRQLPLPRLSKT